MTNKELAEILLPDVKYDVNYYEELYPKRELSEEAIVTRFAPSPTGFVHLGGLLATFIERKMAKQTNGVFFLRIEDTDQKREVGGGISNIISSLKDYDIEFDEGPIDDNGNVKGIYGPYIQSHRKDQYQALARKLIEDGYAYPCFCSEDELTEIRNKQEAIKDRIGYYGHYAKCRNLTNEEIKAKLDNGEKAVIRLKSPGSFTNMKVFHDEIKGDVTMPENDMDIVIIKSDGLPTYHFAHLVDDHFMRTTHIIRGDEWLPSMPIHVQLFEVSGFDAPKYAHISPLTKEENGNRRKLSKRKDPEAACSYYSLKGIPPETVKIYLATVANSNFEEWFMANPDKSVEDFNLTFEKISSSGSLFDLEKLVNISRNYISKLSANEVYDNVCAWAKKYDNSFLELLEKHKNYAIDIFNIERLQDKPRKDYAFYSDIKTQIWYMFDELFESDDKEYEFKNVNDKETIKLILETYINEFYDENADKETWFNNMKALCDKIGFASDMKAYKANPENYKGNVSDVSMVLRVALTSKSMTPDLYDIMRLLGKDRMLERFQNFM